MQQLSADVVIVGGGPAGMAAAIETRDLGLETIVIDERPSLGGQIFKQLPLPFRRTASPPNRRQHEQGKRLIERAEGSGATFWLKTTAWGVWEDTVAVSADDGTSSSIQAGQIILAPGAYDRPVAFPGWTLPGVMTAGAAQALLKAQRVVPGRRVLMVGSGPLLLAFAVELHQLGANVVAVCEVAPPARLRTSVALLRAAGSAHMSLVGRGVAYHAYLRRKRIPFLSNYVITSATGEREVESVTLAELDGEGRPRSSEQRTFEVDTVCLGYGLVPSTELAMQCGCEHVYVEELGGYVPLRDETLSASVPGVFAVGDGAGINGVATAICEGRIAGMSAGAALGTSQASLPSRLQVERHRRATLRRFNDALHALYPSCDTLYELVTPETVVCRCEGVTADAINAAAAQAGRDSSAIKNITRAGMGLCQGRNCSRQVQHILSRQGGVAMGEIVPYNARPPVKPIAIGALVRSHVSEAE